MHSHDTDLIAALAAGDLKLIEQRAAEAEIADCARCSADLVMQRTALEALRASPAPSLDPTERSVLRAAVAEAVGLPVPEPVAERDRSRRRIPWPAISIAAASLAAIVAVVPVLGLLTTGDAPDDAGVALEAPPPGSADDAAESAPATGDDTLSAESAAALEVAPAGDEGADGSTDPTTTVSQRSTMLVVEDIDALASGDAALEGFSFADEAPCVDVAVELLGPEARAMEGLVELENGPGVAYLVTDRQRRVERIVVLLTEDCTAAYAAP